MYWNLHILYNLMLLQIMKRTIYILQQNYEMERLVLLCEYIVQAYSACFSFSTCMPIVLHVHDQHSIGDLYIQDLE